MTSHKQTNLTTNNRGMRADIRCSPQLSKSRFFAERPLEIVPSSNVIGEARVRWSAGSGTTNTETQLLTHITYQHVLFDTTTDTTQLILQIKRQVET